VAQGARNLATNATSGIRESFESGERAAFSATGGASGASAPGNQRDLAAAGTPAWANRLHREQRLREGVTIAAHTLRDGDRPVSGDAPKLDPND
ncbi:MAG: P-type conjugative transfer protein TrbL, partial [Rhodospirillaceae bacterium]